MALELHRLTAATPYIRPMQRITATIRIASQDRQAFPRLRTGPEPRGPRESGATHQGLVMVIVTPG